MPKRRTPRNPALQSRTFLERPTDPRLPLSMSSQIEEDILRSLRRITRAIDLHSKQLTATYGLTGPQLVCLRVIGRQEGVTPSEVARSIALSQATVTGIVDRLVARQLVERRRTPHDRRSVNIFLTQAGRELIAVAPSPLQERFSTRLGQLSVADQASLRDALDQVVQMMDGSELQAAPVLFVGNDDARVFAEGAEPKVVPDYVAPGDDLG